MFSEQIYVKPAGLNLVEVETLQESRDHNESLERSGVQLEFDVIKARLRDLEGTSYASCDPAAHSFDSHSFLKILPIFGICFISITGSIS